MSCSLNAHSTTMSMSTAFLFTVDDLQSFDHGMERNTARNASNGEISQQKMNAHRSSLITVPVGLNSQDYHISTLYVTQLLTLCTISYLASYFIRIHSQLQH